MTQTATKISNYEADYQAIREQRAASNPAWLTQLGDQAWTRFTELGFPTARRGNERWKYTNVAPIANASFGLSSDLVAGSDHESELRRAAPWDDEWINLVFLDGRFSKVLSNLNASDSGNGRILVNNLAEAINSGAANLEQLLAKHVKFQEDGFAALNTAFLGDGAFVQVPDGSVLQSPVNLIYLTSTSNQPTVCYPRTLVAVGKGAQATVIESYVGIKSGALNPEYFTNAVTEISLAEGAILDHYRVVSEAKQAFHVGTSRISQGHDSVFSSASFAIGATLARNDFEVLLDGPGASCNLNGLYLTADAQHMDNLISIDHAQPHTSSQLNYKGILDGKSRAVFGGQVLVRKDAQKVSAHQSDKNLLLSSQAEVDSKPSLLIYADDVQCGHGATAGHVDKDSLFYLRSRGLDADTASRMLVHAFAREVIETVKVEPLKQFLDELFLEAIPETGLKLGGAA
ncbi:MAG: Fe-S cluster assembly protein SufD [SAR202 cluster bacterium Io17-Chloro-G4]|nr:MAG: Fe-S cluster assembly protein SufD [SAR202 cluster bacterium Io17-Chloro-G4]